MRVTQHSKQVINHLFRKHQFVSLSEKLISSELNRLLGNYRGMDFLRAFSDLRIIQRDGIGYKYIPRKQRKI